MVNTRKQLMDYATEYTIIDMKIVWRGRSWAIIKDSMCYNKIDNDWQFEPSPSNRDKDFFESCRFGLIEAKEIVEKLQGLELN